MIEPETGGRASMRAAPVVTAEWRECAEASDKCAAVGQGILNAHKRRTLQHFALPIDGTLTNLAAWAVKFDAFPFTRHGTVDGEVNDVSRDVNKDKKLGVIYPGRAGLDTADIDVEGKKLPVAVAVEIIAGDRQVIDCVRLPTLRRRHESGRKR